MSYKTPRTLKIITFSILVVIFTFGMGTLFSPADAISPYEDDITVEPTTEDEEEVEYTTDHGAVEIDITNQPQENQFAGDPITGVEEESYPRVSVRDGGGNAVGDVPVTVEAIDGDGNIANGTTTRETSEDGVAVFDDLEIHETDDYRLEFSIDEEDENVDGDANNTSEQFTVYSGGPDNISVDTQPEDTPAGEPIGGPPTILVEDEFGNPYVSPDDQGVFVWIEDDTFIDEGQTGVETTEGIASFDDLINNTPNTYTLTFGEDISGETVETEEFEVLEPANFEVAIDEGASELEVVEGENITVVAEIENTGGVEDTQNITLDIDGSRDTVEDVNLNPNESTTETLEWETEIGDADEYTANVSSENHQDNTSVTVEEAEPANFQVNTVTADDVVEGETLQVNYTIENTGDVTDTQDIRLHIQEVQEEVDIEIGVEIEGGDTHSGMLEWESDQTGTFDAVIETDDDAGSDEFTVLEPANFEVAIDEGASELEVDEGENITVVAEIENTGGAEDTQDITLDIDGLRDTVEAVNLNPNESTTETLVWETEIGDADEYTAIVSSENHQDNTSVTVEEVEPANFQVITVTADDVVMGETLEVDYTIENTGNETDTQDIRLSIIEVEEWVDIEEGVEIEAGETHSGTLEWDADQSGTFEALIETSDDFGIDGFEVLEPANFEVSLDEIEDVEEGEDVSISYVVENSGEAQEEQWISIEIGDELIHEQNYELSGGDSVNNTIVWENPDPGAYTAEIRSDDDSDQEDFEVFAAPTLTIDAEVTEDNAVADGSDEVEFEVTVLNEAREPVEETIVEVDDAGDVDALGGLAAGDTAPTTEDGVATFTATSTAGGTFEVQFSEANAGSASATATFVWERPAIPTFPTPEEHFDVVITDTNSPVEPDEVMEFDIEVTNTGAASGEQEIALEVADFYDTQTVSLDEDAERALTFEWDTTVDDLGTHDATVSSADTSDTAEVEVTADRPEYVSSVVPHENPETIQITFDQDVSLNPDTADTAGFTVEIRGNVVEIIGASASGNTVTLTLDSAVGFDDLVTLRYDGESDNVVNEHDLEALPFSIDDDVNVEVEGPFEANLTAIDPTTNEPGDRFSIDVTVEDGVDFSAEDSILPAGDATYEWVIGDDTFTTTEPRLTHQFLEPGTFSASVTITVEDRSDTAEFTLTVFDETPPDAVLAGEETVAVGEDPSLDASGSTDNVEIAEYQWDFGDGTTDSGADLSQPEHAFDEAGEYTVEVTVVDTSDNEATATLEIVVDDDDGGIGTREASLLLLLLLALAAGGGYYYMRRRR